MGRLLKLLLLVALVFLGGAAFINSAQATHQCVYNSIDFYDDTCPNPPGTLLWKATGEPSACGDEPCGLGCTNEDYLTSKSHTFSSGFTPDSPTCGHAPTPPPDKPGGLVPCGRQTQDLSTDADETLPCGFCHFFTLFRKVLDWIMFAIAPVLGLLFIVIGGFLILTSRGSPAQFEQGKQFIIWALLGFAIMLIAWILINSVFTVLKLQSWTGLQVGSWWKTTCNIESVVASFEVTPKSGGPPLLVKFTNNSTGDITKWLWDFGDGTTSTVEDPSSKTYANPGIYIVTLNVEGPGGRASASKTIIVVGITYKTDSDFAKGTMAGVESAGNKLQLEGSKTANLPYIWVAVSSNGTIVKISTEDTDPGPDDNSGKVLGEYRTAPQTVAPQPLGGNPSRTTVDNTLNVWVANRNDSRNVSMGALGVDKAGKPIPQSTKDMGSVTYVGLKEKGQCVDRNKNSVIETSTGLGDVRGWDNALTGADDFGGVSKAEDECILYYVRVNSPGTRHVSVNENNDVWVGGTGTREFDLIDGKTGKIIRQEPSVGFGGYGGLIDKNNVIWSARSMLRWDTALPLTGPNGVNWTGYLSDSNSYGMCIDPGGNVWSTDLGPDIHKFSPDGTLVGTFLHGGTWAQGCVIDKNGDVWVAHSLLGSNTVGHIKNNGTFVGNVTLDLVDLANPTGVAVDGNGKIWATGYATQKVYRINPALGPIGGGGTQIGEVDLTTVNLGGALYNYSDMTGGTLTAPPLTGTWSVTYDSGVPGLEWGTITWTSIEPGDSSIKIKASSSNDCVTFGPEQDVAQGVDLTVANGVCLKVRVIFTRSSTDLDSDGVKDSPILTSLTIKGA